MYSSSSSLRQFFHSFSVVRLFVAALGLLLTGTHYGYSAVDTLALMPVPASVHQEEGSFSLTARLGVTYPHFHDARLEAGVDRMLSRLQYVTGLPQSRGAKDASGSGALVIDVKSAGQAVQSVDEDESYSLVVTGSQVQLSAPTVVGALRGMETLLQLIECRTRRHLPAVRIEDTPRFRWRGLMIDVSRHFEPVRQIERTLDGMAMVKLNVFHWHLSDDQGFRAESKIYPKLTGVGSNGEFYTQEQMREVVAYARERGIRVVPEFDMPGHSVSWMVGYPQIGSSRAHSICRMSREYTMRRWTRRAKAHMSSSIVSLAR